jgi:hypothetical protein
LYSWTKGIEEKKFLSSIIDKDQEHSQLVCWVLYENHHGIDCKKEISCKTSVDAYKPNLVTGSAPIKQESSKRGKIERNLTEDSNVKRFKEIHITPGTPVIKKVKTRAVSTENHDLDKFAYQASPVNAEIQRNLQSVRVGIASVDSKKTKTTSNERNHASTPTISKKFDLASIFDDLF